MEYTLLRQQDKDDIYTDTVREIEARHFSVGLAIRRAEATGDEQTAVTLKAQQKELEEQHKALT